MDKRDRAQKMKRDKRNKDSKRTHDHSKKAENKSSNTAASNSQLNSTKDQKCDAKPVINKETVEEIQEQSVFDFANLKRETEDINQLNKTYSKRQITSNWSKYETPLRPEDDEVISKGADFESLLGAPISEGGHFKFKSEQMWSQNPLQFSDIFSLDVKHLARSVSRIPFYEQVSLSKELFSKDELEIMDKEAAQNSDRYKNSVEEPVVTNFYEVLKSSLVESQVQKTPEKKSLIKSESMVKEPTDNIRVMVSFLENQVDDIQPVKSSQFEKGLDSSPESQDIIPTHKTEEKELTVIKNNRHIADPEVVLDQISTSNLNDSIENKNMPTKDEVPAEVNVIPENTEVLVNNVSSEFTPQTNDSTLKQNPKTVEDDDELDFLLTLKQPVSGPKFAAKLPSKPPATNDILSDDLGALSLSTTTETKEDLDDWLDSMLAD